MHNSPRCKTPHHGENHCDKCSVLIDFICFGIQLSHVLTFVSVLFGRQAALFAVEIYSKVGWLLPQRQADQVSKTWDKTVNHEPKDQGRLLSAPVMALHHWVAPGILSIHTFMSCSVGTGLVQGMKEKSLESFQNRVSSKMRFMQQHTVNVACVSVQSQMSNYVKETIFDTAAENPLSRANNVSSLILSGTYLVLTSCKLRGKNQLAASVVHFR